MENIFGFDIAQSEHEIQNRFLAVNSENIKFLSVHNHGGTGFFTTIIDSNNRILIGRRHFIDDAIWVKDVKSFQNHFYSLHEIDDLNVDYKRILLTKFSESNTRIWQKEYTLNNTIIPEIYPLSMSVVDSSIVILAASDSITFLLKIDLNGNFIKGVQLIDSGKFLRLGGTSNDEMKRPFLNATNDRLYCATYSSVRRFGPNEVSVDTVKVYELDFNLNILRSKKFVSINPEFKANELTGISTYSNQNFKLSFSNKRLGNGFFSNEETYLDAQLNIVNQSNRAINIPIANNRNHFLVLNKNVSDGFLKVYYTDDGGGEYFIRLCNDQNNTLGTGYFEALQSTNLNLNRLHKIIDIEEHDNDFYFYQANETRNFQAPGPRIISQSVDIIKVSKSDLNFPCEDNLSPFELTSPTINWLDTFPNNYIIDTISFDVIDRVMGSDPLSFNQDPDCSTNLDSCSFIDLKMNSHVATGCSGRNYRFTVNSVLVDSIEWLINDSIVSNQSQLNFSFEQAGTYDIKVNGYNKLLKTCFSSDSSSIVVYPSPELNLSDTIVCKGDSTQLFVDGASSYLWFPNVGLSCNDCPNPIVSINDSSFYAIHAIDSLGCTVIDTININVYPKPKASISGTNTVCPGSIDIWFGLNPLDSFSSTWWIDTVGIITQDYGDSIFTEWPVYTDSAIVYNYVQYPAGCIGDTISFSVKVNTLLEPRIIQNEDTVCYNSRSQNSFELSYNSNGSIYLWEISNGEIINGDSTSRVVVNWDSLGTGKLIVREYSVNNTDSCFGMDSISLEIVPNPVQEIVIKGQNLPCFNSSSLYSIDSLNVSSRINWNYTGSTSPNTNSSQINLMWDTLGEFSIIAQEINVFGCTGLNDTLPISVKALPQTSRVGSDTTLCLNQDFENPDPIKSYEVVGFDNSTFKWSITGGEIISPDSLPLIDVRWDTTISKSLIVQEISEFGCEGEPVQIKDYIDFSQLEIFSVSIANKNQVRIDFELENLRSFPSDSVMIQRKMYFPQSSDWEDIAKVEKYIKEYYDNNIQSDDLSYAYRVVGFNSCEDEIRSRDHNTILLNASSIIDPKPRSFENSSIELEWNPYRNWANGIGKYELYERINQTLIKVAESQDLIFQYTPSVPNIEHCFVIKALENSEFPDSSWSNELCIEVSRLVELPNFVSANNDGLNDQLLIKNLEVYQKHRLKIYNRWGNEIFNTTKYKSDWPGSEILSGVYFYELTIEDTERGLQNSYTGWIQVVK